MLSTRLKLNPNLNISDFDTNSADKSLLEVPAGKGKHNRYIIPKALAFYLKMFDGKTSTKKIAEQYTLYENIENNDDKFLLFINEYCIKHKILLPENQEQSSAIKNTASSHYLKFKVPLIRSSHVNALSKALKSLYNPVVASFLIALSLCCTTFYFATESLSNLGNFLELGAYDSLIFLVIMALGLFCHELGHTTAAYIRGSRNMDIGAGIYFIFIVFYADLSESWRLKRNERALIDIGGIYFQIITIGILTCLNISLNSFIIHSSIVALLLSLVLNLNPFFRMDGYWLAVDLLDTPNLKQIVRLRTAAFFSKLFNNTKTSNPEVSNMIFDKKINIYVLLSNIFMFVISYIFAKKLTSQINEAIPNSVFALINSVTSKAPTVNTLDSSISLTWQTVVTLFLIYFFYKILRSIINFIRESTFN